MRLAACILAHDAARWLPDAVGSVLGHVDRVVVAVDDRTADGTQSWLRLLARQRSDLAWHEYRFDDATGFAGAYNALLESSGADWRLILDSDEAIDPAQAAGLRDLVDRGEREGLDGFVAPRKNWWDLERTRYRQEWWPDHSCRLFRAHVRYRWRVHQHHVGLGRTATLAPEELTIHHFNLAYRDQAAWDAVNVVYDRLLALDRADGRES